MASLTAATMTSWSSSTSSGSTAAGSIVTSSSSRPPLTRAVTAPPPAEAVTDSCWSSACTRAMSSCIFCICLSIFCGFMPPAILSSLVA